MTMPPSILLLDVGNSRLKWALTTAPRAPLGIVQALPHDGDPASTIASLAGQLAAPPQAVCIANVTGSAHEQALSQAVQQLWHCTPQFARSSAECGGLKSGYADTGRLGVDRWLAMLAVWTETRAAFNVASAGTAITFDAVDINGQHHGGLIAPGLAAMITATLGHTRFAVGEMAAHFERGLGRDTEACVRQGALHAAAGLLDRLAAQHAGPCRLAGGDAATLQPHLASAWQMDVDLVLQGLAVWAQLSSSR